MGMFTGSVVRVRDKQVVLRGRVRAWRGWIDAEALQDLPHGRGGDSVAEPDELTRDAAVAPGAVLSRHPRHQGPDRLWGECAAGLSSRVAPVTSDEVGVNRPGVSGELRG
jgi:hypothetical protein